MKTSKHPLIREIQLGKSVDEVVNDHFMDYDFQGDDIHQKLPEIIREIVRINKNDLKFAVSLDSDWCAIIFLNGESKLTLDYWNYDDGYALDDNANLDCELLNKIVDRLYGTKRKKPVAKVPMEKFLKKNGDICPYCGRTPTTLDEVTWNNRDIMGCTNCGETWSMYYKTVATGFER